MTTEKAELSDGRMVEYVVVPDPPAGGMKCTYFGPDRSYVVQFDHDASLGRDPARRARLDALLGKFNPTTDTEAGGYWRRLFCWPTGIVVRPRLGLVCPTYPSNFFFKSGPFLGKDKEGTWFVLPRPRRMLPAEERGTWVNYFAICILLTRAVRRLHQAGLAHTDLSPRSILIDPSSGLCCMAIDIDSLVIPGFSPPDVMGTPGYVAPEVLATSSLPLNDGRRKSPSALTDLHSMAILIYELLLLRHPLRGPKEHSTASEEDELLSMGEKALFIENPHDTSNRPAELSIPYTVLGPHLGDLIYRAFVKGLHSPDDRPAAIEWERALVRTWDLRVDCQNPDCPNKWYVFDASNPVCPFCGTRRTGSVPILKLRKEWKPGQWNVDGELVVHNNMAVFRWHVFDNQFPGERCPDNNPVAFCVFYQNRWLLVNQTLPSLMSPGGSKVPPGQAVELVDGALLRLADEPHGRTAEVQLVYS